MTYDKELVSSKQRAVIKSITELLNALGGVDVDNESGDEIPLDDGSVMTLGLASSKGDSPLGIEKISVTNARLNVDITIKRKPEKILLTLKKKDSNE